MKEKKGQLSLSDAPTIVLIVGLVFLVMATLALVSDKYNDAFPAGESATVYNETVTQAELVGVSDLDGAGAENAQAFSLLEVWNGTSNVAIGSGNYTFSGGTLTNTTSEFTTEDWLASYSYSYSGVSANVTTDLNTNIADNTSIAGILLTISLVGIVLGILISIFVSTKRSRL